MLLPPPFTSREHGDWTLFCDCTEFETAEFLYMKNQMSGSDVDKLIDTPPFTDHKDLYSTINVIPLGEVTWENFTMKFNGEGLVPSDSDSEARTPWMDTPYTAWFQDPHAVVHNMLANPDFKDKMEYMPYHEWKGEGGDAKRQWHNVMLGDWAWNQADEIAKDPATHGSTFIPILLGSDKTTVSVTTRQNDYYPLYASIGNVKNNVHCTHCNAVTVVGFLAIPKTVKQYSEDTFMTVPEVVHFGDSHFRRVIYGLGPYITDYPEQVVLSCIVSNWCAKCFALPADLDGKDVQLHAQIVTNILCDNVDFSTLWYQWGVDADIVLFTNNYPHADIHKLLSPNILHQLIKGTFKDHLVIWVEKYLECIHGKTHAKVVMDDIDRRIAAAPSFAGLCWFPQGHNNSKALMKVYLPAIEGHVPNDIDIITENTLEEIKEALDRFHCYCKIFQETGHSLMHYVMLICMFGAPNGVCSSITDKFNTLGQMLLTNQHLDKLAAARTDFMAHGMLVDDNGEMDDGGEVDNSGEADERGKEDESNEEDDGAVEGAQVQYDEHTSDTIPLSACPRFEGHIKVFGSAVSTFFAPSDPSGIGGMQHKHIHSVPSWHRGPGCYDTVFVNTGSEDGIHSMEVVHVLCFFPFHYLVSDKPDPGNGMWMSSTLGSSQSSLQYAAHLLSIFGEEFVPEKATFHETLDTYCGFYVNKFADHHSFEIAS
ncbi:uncharacterized protein BJ212DRAFT_1449385 [Suillus subaureus]|uniref:Uncharacterized protein n=1 Tax=Suillus subaureus TaxID=48587 RepID=A0A9P7E013_9AGAM|nr:uncharacterized protein BJ212DRAFT_1449385 [Suillus subaureus]KAG1807119.1 hypothetical protein BJ212DRAFT_1449385 [Suillus subaureus]